MNPESFLDVWTGTAQNNNGWEMKITISVIQPFEVGAMLGILRYLSKGKGGETRGILELAS